MYDSEYARIWIQNHESGKDTFRTQYLEPYFKEKLLKLSDQSLLDVGCGWGSLLNFLNTSVYYTGVDITKDFFAYIRTKFPNRNIVLLPGSLPSDIGVPDNAYDMCFCSQVLHTIPELESSLRLLFSKVKTHGECIIVTFCNGSRKALMESFHDIVESDNNHIIGQAKLPSGLSFHSVIYFHTEEMYERELQKYGPFLKKFLGPLFVVYECRKSI